jgi:hypothetical protein
VLFEIAGEQADEASALLRRAGLEARTATSDELDATAIIGSA